MSGGEIQQVADPVAIYERPATTFVADFIGSPSINFLNGELQGGTALLAGRPLDGARAQGNGPVTLGVRPEDVILGVPGSGVLEGTIAFTEPYGGVVVAFVAPEARGVVANRDFVAASVDVHHAIEIGAHVGIGFRGSASASSTPRGSPWRAAEVAGQRPIALPASAIGALLRTARPRRTGAERCP